MPEKQDKSHSRRHFITSASLTAGIMATSAAAPGASPQHKTKEGTGIYNIRDFGAKEGTVVLK